MRMMLSTTDWPTPWRFSPIALSGLSLMTIVGNGTRPASSVRRRMPPLVVSSVPPITRAGRARGDDAGHEVGAVVEQDVGSGGDDGGDVRLVLLRACRRGDRTRSCRALRR